MKTKILSIDDEALVLFINKKLLKGNFPEEDLCFFNSASLALDYLEENENETETVFVIFLDINMPEINGWEFMELLKEKFPKLNFKIHMLTSSIDQRDQNKAEEYEFVDSYIVKPLDKLKLSKVLDSIPKK